MIAALSPNGQNLCFGDDPPLRLLVATIKGVNVLERERPGAPWIDRGRVLDGHHCGSITIEPRRGGIFAGMHSGGLYFSADGGETWERRTNGITLENVFTIAYANWGDATVLYAGTEPASMFRSDDYGQSWVEQPGIKEAKGRDKWVFPAPPHLAHTKTMTVDQRNPNVVYAGVEQGDLFKTTDGGASWFEINDYSKPTDWTYRDVHLLTIHPDNPNELFLTTGMGVYHSLDAGAHWTHIVDNGFRIGYPDHFIVSPLDGNTIFITGAAKNPGEWRASHSAESTIMKTRDRMKTWTDASAGLPDDRRPNIEAMSLAAYPGGFTLFAGNTDGEVYASDDAAEHWTRIAGGLAPVSKGGHYRGLQLA
ncbi:MAG TPA: hypothetical protein VGP41_04095 [Candidatus Lustribacter sp.]|jgi:photosystem II stability/assembly factor-like uncharacterized protein|nr:hypothetical protein [Candidatus Lustribacter sp.]